MTGLGEPQLRKTNIGTVLERFVPMSALVLGYDPIPDLMRHAHGLGYVAIQSRSRAATDAGRIFLVIVEKRSEA